MNQTSAAKFDADRAGEYARQSRIALAGYDACHALSACMLSAALGAGRAARLLVAGAGGTAGEIITAATLEPHWSFVAVDPAPAMLELAKAQIAGANLSERVTFVEGLVSDLQQSPPFDAAIMIGVIHHLPGDAAKRAILSDIAARLKPQAPLVLAGNVRPYASQPELMAAWANLWRLHGTADAEIEEKLARILQGAEPPRSEEALAALLNETGFGTPLRFFASLFWGAWLIPRDND
ncbi:class I SAM-dependent methyltransferase [Martelella sp. HB161492]|uniref:class I SAM-dependent methyltransferase n=1 Tax=Martelella sp. HB161492 TaxID=2720726 RepID=UPI001590F442|nr:class I SAM-dependent methyltransferase [Martelella sp. HB161492]